VSAGQFAKTNRGGAFTSNKNRAFYPIRPKWIEQWSGSSMRLFSSRPAGLAAKSFLKHNQATIAQGKIGFLELCASPLGVRIGQTSSYWCMRKKQ
jgi:hypothetical protein